MNEEHPSAALTQACTKIGNGMVVRYGSKLFNGVHNKLSDFITIFSVVLMRSGCEAQTAEALNGWLQQGLRPLSEYPPTIETLINLANLVKSYPPSDYQRKMKHVWYALDTRYGQVYNKFWRTDKSIEELTRERVWLCAFEKMGLTEEEISDISSRIGSCAAFRQYPPGLDQFLDAAMAVRQNAPLVEEAWLIASSRHMGQANPFVQAAKAAISSHDMNVNSKDRNMEVRFKAIYRAFLSAEMDLPEPVLIEKQPATRDFIPQDELQSKIQSW